MYASETMKALDPRKRVFTLWEEFRNFAFKGNVIDLAVAVIIGMAFGKVVDSLVKQIIMPLISLVMPSEQGYREWKFVYEGQEIPYGVFLGELLNFFVVALALFLFLKKFLGWITRIKKIEATAPAGPPPPTKDQELLMEIRDLLKKQG